MWTQEWPTEPGWYWFYGQCFRNWTGEWCPRLYYVTARRCSNGMVYTTDGHFMYEEEAQGWWQPAVLPELPEDAQL